MITNNQNLLDNVYERQKKKFKNQTKEELWAKLIGEIIELQQERRKLFMQQEPTSENKEAVLFEEADIIIMANRLYQEYHDEVAWLILDQMYNYETAKYVAKKWEIVEKRNYHKDKNGLWQHD